MKSRMLFAALLAATLAQAAEGPQSPIVTGALSPLSPLPRQWSQMGNGGPEALPGKCELGLDASQSMDGQSLASVRCANTVLPGFGGMHHTIQTAQYAGKRVRVSGWIMASGITGVTTPQYSHVPGHAGLWLAVGSARRGVRMDRMDGRGVSGSTGWEQREFVVDVPADNSQMFVGFWMQGTGQVWARDFRIEEVPATVAVNFLVEDPQRKIGPDLSLQTQVVARPQDAFLPPPPKWLVMGAQGFELCDAGVDAKLLAEGQRNLSINCSVPNTVIMRQSFEAAPFWGKRVRFSGWIRTQDFEATASPGAEGGGGLFLNVDPQSQVRFSNLTGTTEWQFREMEIDISRNLRWILVGLTVSGKGQVWGRDFKFEEVPGFTPGAR
jgi:uncharacterized protein (DUF2237 family)